MLIACQTDLKNNFIMDKNYLFFNTKNMISFGSNRPNGDVYSKINFKVTICCAR